MTNRILVCVEQASVVNKTYTSIKKIDLVHKYVSIDKIE